MAVEVYITKTRLVLVFIPLFLTFGALVCSILSLVGSTRNVAVLNSTHLIRIDLQNMNALEVFGLALDGYSTLLLGLPDTYSIGSWGFCRGSHSDSGKLSYTSCSSPKSMFHPNFTQILEDDLLTWGQLQYTQVVFPDKLITKLALLGLYATTQNAIFVFTFIGVITCAILLFITYFSFHSHFMLFLSLGWAVSSFVALLIAGACATGMYHNVTNALKKEYSTYGIKAHMDEQYYGVIWGACAAMAISLIFLFWGICFGSTKVYPRHRGAILVDSLGSEKSFAGSGSSGSHSSHRSSHKSHHTSHKSHRSSHKSHHSSRHL